MPLLQEQLFSSLSRIFAIPSSSKKSTEIATALWQYSQGITPTSIATLTSLEFLISQFELYDGKEHSLADSLTEILPLYARRLALGMQPVFTGIVPSKPLPDFRSVVRSVTTSYECADRLSSEIHIWLISGIAINNTSGVVVAWGVI
jgi:hypothetical protein